MRVEEEAGENNDLGSKAVCDEQRNDYFLRKEEQMSALLISLHFIHGHILSPITSCNTLNT